MKKLLALILLLISIVASAQDYEQAIGVRAGYSGGLSYRKFFSARYGGEIIAQYNRNGFQLAGLAEYQSAPFNEDRLYLFYGGGVHTGNWNGQFALGLTAIGGIEYVLRDLPLSISLDWKPMFNIIRTTALDPVDFAFTLRYTF